MDTLRDVKEAIDEREAKVFYGLNVFVVNFVANQEHPQQLTYPGCMVKLPNGQTCLKAVDGLNACAHNPLESPFSEMYRFSIGLVDGSIGQDCPPFTVSLWHVGAAALLGMKPAVFQKLSCNLSLRFRRLV